MPQKQRKIAVMGFRNVGKTSIITQFVQSQFSEVYNPTIENTFRKCLKVDGQDYQLVLLDTCGQDELSSISETYCMNIDGYVLVYSITNEKSFEIAQKIHCRLQDMTGKRSFPLVLVGNKLDLKKKRDVSTASGEDLADQWGGAFLEVSAKMNQNVNAVFKTILDEILKAEDDGLDSKKNGCLCS